MNCLSSLLRSGGVCGWCFGGERVSPRVELGESAVEMRALIEEVESDIGVELGRRDVAADCKKMEGYMDKQRLIVALLSSYGVIQVVLYCVDWMWTDNVVDALKIGSKPSSELGSKLYGGLVAECCFTVITSVLSMAHLVFNSLWYKENSAIVNYGGNPLQVGREGDFQMGMMTQMILGCISIVLGAWYLARDIITLGHLKDLLDCIETSNGCREDAIGIISHHVLLNRLAWVIYIVFFIAYVLFGLKEWNDAKRVLNSLSRGGQA